MEKLEKKLEYVEYLLRVVKEVLDNHVEEDDIDYKHIMMAAEIELLRTVETVKDALSELKESE